jgi:hypothetical protein
MFSEISTLLLRRALGIALSRRIRNSTRSAESCIGNGPQETSDKLLEIWVVTGAVARYDTFDIDYIHTKMYLDPKDDNTP